MSRAFGAPAASMHDVHVPAGSGIRLTATARPKRGIHRWDLQLVSLDPAIAVEPRLVFGSQIGGAHLHQRLDIPPQATDCRLEVRSRHAVKGGWCDDCFTVERASPAELRLGCWSAALAGSRQRTSR